MAIAVSGTPAAVGATSITLPAHTVGQHIFLFASRVFASPPTKPAAGGTVPTWIDANTAGGIYVAYCQATATNHTSGTWTNATRMAAVVFNGVNPADPVGQIVNNSGTSTATVSASALPSLDVADGSSAILVYYTVSNTGSGSGWAAAPTGYSRLASSQTASSHGNCLNSKTVTTSDGAVTQTLNLNPSGNFQAMQIEILAAPAAGGNTGAFFAMF
jgi:hypothetical protein